VFGRNRRPGEPAAALGNVVLTPHVAAYSDEYLEASWRLSQNGRALASGRYRGRTSTVR
jgi:phosphoglycerate dehydrogenase-like enzyme